MLKWDLESKILTHIEQSMWKWRVTFLGTFFWDSGLTFCTALQVSGTKIGRPKVQWSRRYFHENGSKFIKVQCPQEGSSSYKLAYSNPICYHIYSNYLYIFAIKSKLPSYHPIDLGGAPAGPQIWFVFVSGSANLRILNGLTRIQILGY